jgi:hypothetical protein
MDKVLGLTLITMLIVCLLASGISCTKPSTELETDITSPLITGADWNNMTRSQKEPWVHTALDAMMMSGELKESERQLAIYYVKKLDEVFYDPVNKTKLVARELSAICSQ